MQYLETDACKLLRYKERCGGHYLYALQALVCIDEEVIKELVVTHSTQKLTNLQERVKATTCALSK